MQAKHVPGTGYALGAGMLLLLVAFYPPGPFTWSRFLEDQAPVHQKLGHLAEFYLLPAVLSFGSIVLLQIQMRMSMLGARGGALFAVCVLGSVAMVTAWRTLVHGLASVPGYSCGLALAYTLMSRVYALRPSHRMFLGQRWPVVVWRSDTEQIREIQKRMAAQATHTGL